MRLFFRRLGPIPGIWVLRIAGPAFTPGFVIRAGHADGGEKLENLILVHEVKTLRVKTYKMGTILAAVATEALIDAKQVRVGAIGAFSQRNADLGDNDFTGVTDNK
jgi:hypothetical protein